MKTVTQETAAIFQARIDWWEAYRWQHDLTAAQWRVTCDIMDCLRHAIAHVTRSQG